MITLAIYCDVDKYVQRGTLCCKPVFNCYPGYEVQPCSKMYESEKCTKCPRGQVQPEYIDSYSEKRDCFRPKESCTAQDIIPSRGREYCYPQYCKCDTANCFVDDHCVCVKYPGCPINKTLHPVLKTCVDCPPYTFKDHFGCGPCITDILLIYSRHRHTNDTGKENEIPETDQEMERQGQQRDLIKDSLKENITDKRYKILKSRCNKCKRLKVRKGRKQMKTIKWKLKRCRRKRKRCLRRQKRIIENFTERRI